VPTQPPATRISLTPARATRHICHSEPGRPPLANGGEESAFSPATSLRRTPAASLRSSSAWCYSRSNCPSVQ